jgi:hypothetical protein
MTTDTLQNWSVVPGSIDPFVPPELSGIKVVGKRQSDGKVVMTSRVKRVDGRRVTTKSGSVYVLGAISRQYRAWLKQRGIAYDKANPIRSIDP